MKFLFLLAFLLPAFSQANVPSQIFVGTYNLHEMKSPLPLKEDLRALKFVQIWAFQEVVGQFNERTEKSILAMLPEGKWYTHLQKVNLTDQKNQIWEGQVIASRFPIESIQVVPLKHTDVKERVALVANFKTDAGEDFFFANTDHEVDIFSITMKDREKQLNSLVEFFNLSDTKGIVTGDFNTTDGAKEILATENNLLRAGFQRTKSLDKNSHTFETMFIKKELDHLFSRGVTTSERFRYDGRRGSDHYPIYMKVSL